MVTGFITNNSVETTVRVASTIGFRIQVVAESLSNLSGEYAEIITTAELITSRRCCSDG